MEASEILIDVAPTVDVPIDLCWGFDSNESDSRLDAIQIGNNVFTMQGAEDIGGEAGDGYAYTWGVVVDGMYEPAVDGQWADTPEQARDAVIAWINTVAQ